jgi:hypothetical protein
VTNKASFKTLMPGCQEALRRPPVQLQQVGEAGGQRVGGRHRQAQAQALSAH